MPALPYDLAPETLLYVVLVFVLAGVVKGVIGIGLPLICVPLLANTVGPITAMALMAVPITTVNIWQAIQSGYCIGALRRFRLAFPLQIAGVAAGVSLLTQMPVNELIVIVGALVVVVAVTQMFPLAFTISEDRERWLTPVVGALSGVMGGLTSFLGPLMAIYLAALRLTKDQFVGAIALFYFIAAIPFFAGLAVEGRLGGTELIVSTVASGLILLGILVGQVVRKRVSQEVFRKVVLIALLLIGLNMIRKGAM